MVQRIKAWHRRHAIHIVSELPEEPADARAVLELALEVVEKFLIGETKAEPKPKAQARAPVSCLSSARAARSLSLIEEESPSSAPS